MADRDDYHEREQAWVKHWMLEKYLERLILKVGTKWKRFVYIDAFAGPWGAKSEDLSDTSFGRALSVMRTCQLKLAKNGRQVPMHAVFFEKDRKRAARLMQYAKLHSSASLTIDAFNADFMSNVDAVAGALRDDDFAFALIDPTGYKEIAPARLAPLLKKRGVEVLINLMWDFINRFWSHSQECSKLDEIFGVDRHDLVNGDSLEFDASKLYANRLKMAGGGVGGRLRASTFPVQHAFKDRTHYFLIYATHSPVGLLTFGEIAEATWEEQAKTRARTAVRRRSGDTLDIFGGEIHAIEPRRLVNGTIVRDAWLRRIPIAGSEIVVTSDLMAELLEDCGCFTSDLQAEAARLMQEGIIENKSASPASIARRTKNAIQVEKRETIRRLR